MDHSQSQDNPNGVNPAGAPIEDDKLPPRAWLMRNGVYLVLFAALGNAIVERLQTVVGFLT